MWTTDTGIRFELSPWRARRIIAQAKEIARRRREGQARLPGGVLHDLQRMARFARPVKSMNHNSTGSQLRVFEAALPDGVLRVMTQSRPGSEAVLGVAFRALEGELEQEAQYGGRVSIRWEQDEPVTLRDAAAKAPAEPGVYLLFRRSDEGWSVKYVGKGMNLRSRLFSRFEYTRQHGDEANLRVIYGKVSAVKRDSQKQMSVQEAISAAEQAIIRTLDPNKSRLSNISSINQFLVTGPDGLTVNSVLPAYLRGKVGPTNKGYRPSANRLVLPQGARYELDFK